MLIKLCPACNTENEPSAQRCSSCSAMLIGVDLAEPKPSATTATGAAAAAPAEPIAAHQQAGAPANLPRRCPQPDCAQLNPAEAVRCLYCDRPLEPEPQTAAPAFFASIRWPWTEHSPITDRLLIGREPPAPAALVSRLERDYANVSRRHAELRVHGGTLWVIDLGSRNGTFVNDMRIAPNQPVRLVNGATVRFAAKLIAQVCIQHGN